MITKSGSFFKYLYASMFKASKGTGKDSLLEAICTSAVEHHLESGRPSLRVTDLSSVMTFTFDEVREELLQDPRVFPNYGHPNILKLDPTGGTE